MTALLDEFGRGDARERAEAWRYSRTALQALGRTEFFEADATLALAPELVVRFDWPDTRGHRVVFVNGRYSSAHSDAAEVVAPGATAGRTLIALGRDDACVHVVYANVPGERAGRWSADLAIEVTGRRCRVIEQHVGGAGASAAADLLGVVRVNARVASGAELETTTLADLADNVSLYRRAEITIDGAGAHTDTKALFGGRLQRFEDDVRLAGPQSRHRARGVFALRGREHVDVHLDVRHAARDTASDVLWRGVADQRARGILHGAITVAAGADGADARLETKNLLLSPHAEIDAQPVLEICADEVKASHGATVGQLDERALFYLRSRGLAAANARSLLIRGFCREAVADAGSAGVRARIDALIEQQLPQAADDVRAVPVNKTEQAK